MPNRPVTGERCLLDEFRRRAAALGVTLDAGYSVCGVFGDLFWRPSEQSRSLAGWTELIEREPAFTLNGRSRYLAFARICDELRYCAGPYPIYADTWSKAGASQRRAIEAEPPGLEIGVLPGVDEAVQLAAAYLGGAALDEIAIPRRCRSDGYLPTSPPAGG